MENQRVTAADKTPEQIQQEMSQTRDALTEKVAALESQVVGTVQTAANTLTDTVDSVKSIITTAPGAVSDTVKQAAAAVTETVKRSLDVRGQIREHPWTSVGVSTLLGAITGWVVAGMQDAARSPATVESAYTPPSQPSRPSHPSVFDELITMVGHKLREVTENLIDSATSAVNKNISEGVPKLVDAAAGMAADRLAADQPHGSRLAGFAG